MKKHNEMSAGFSWRTADRATKGGNWLRDLAIALAIALAASILGMVGDAYAQGKSIQISGNNRTVMLTVPIGKSEDVRTDTSFFDVVVGDPDVADVNPLTDRALSILGKKIGTTRVSVYAEGKKLVGIFDVEVSYDITRLTNELRRRFPGSKIQASTVNGRIMLSGEAPDAATLDKVVTIARQFGPGVINSVSVMSPQQVLLEVRFIEISRTAVRRLHAGAFSDRNSPPRERDLQYAWACGNGRLTVCRGISDGELCSAGGGLADDRTGSAPDDRCIFLGRRTRQALT